MTVPWERCTFISRSAPTDPHRCTACKPRAWTVAGVVQGAGVAAGAATEAGVQRQEAAPGAGGGRGELGGRGRGERGGRFGRGGRGGPGPHAPAGPPPGGAAGGQGQPQPAQHGQPAQPQPWRPSNTLHRYARGDFQLGGDQHEAARFLHQAWQLLQEDADRAVELLGSKDGYCLQYIEEICSSSFGMEVSKGAERVRTALRLPAQGSTYYAI